MPLLRAHPAAAVAFALVLLAPLAALAPRLAPPDEAAPEDAAPSFAQVLVDAAESTGEPGIVVDARASPATVYVVAPEASSQLWRSTDGGASFERLARTPGGSGDSDVAVDALGRVFVSDLLGSGLRTTVPVATSLDGGESFARSVAMDPASGDLKWDRQWTVARGDGHVVMSARSGGTYAAWVSRDAAETFDGPHTVATGVSVGGPLVFAPDGALYAPFVAFDEVRVARSLDGGASWESFRVAGLNGDTYIFPSLDADSDGNLYLAWSFGSGPINALVAQHASKTVTYLASSRDGGASWSAPAPVAPTARTTLFPWVAAGGPGKVNVAYLEASGAVDPNVGSPVTTWSVGLAQSLNALDASPSWAHVTAAPSVHTGSICTSGVACVGPQNLGFLNAPTPFDRRHLDFFEMDLDADGNAVIAYGKSRPVSAALGDVVFSQIDVMVARQTGGSRV